MNHTTLYSNATLDKSIDETAFNFKICSSFCFFISIQALEWMREFYRLLCYNVRIYMDRIYKRAQFGFYDSIGLDIERSEPC